MKRNAFTLVELIVTVAIVSSLVGLLIPAVQSARESSRISGCKNNLRQLATSLLLHEQSIGHFPSAGWGSKWTGDPDKGAGRTQPGGWIFGVLPYMEHKELHNLAADGDPDNITPQQREMAKQALETEINITTCPSRPRTQPTPTTFHNSDTPGHFPGSHYAINAGDNHVPWGEGPEPTTMQFTSPMGTTGIAFQRSEIKIAHIKDGLSNTYLLGEKGIAEEVGPLAGSQTNARWTQDPPADTETTFGSVHPSGFSISMCDGSVKTISEIDPETHQRLGNRKDGQIAAIE